MAGRSTSYNCSWVIESFTCIRTGSARSPQQPSPLDLNYIKLGRVVAIGDPDERLRIGPPGGELVPGRVVGDIDGILAVGVHHVDIVVAVPRKSEEHTSEW